MPVSLGSLQLLWLCAEGIMGRMKSPLAFRLILTNFSLDMRPYDILDFSVTMYFVLFCVFFSLMLLVET